MKRIASLALSLALAAPSALADWTMDPSQSRLHFLSTKKEHITETHQFDQFSGTISDKGELSVAIDLLSVNTGIPIRNERMQNKLFRTDYFPQAKVTAQLDSSLLQLAVGESRFAKVKATLELAGNSTEVTIALVVNRLADNKLTASTTAPIVVDARALKLEEGIEALKKLAGLSSISLTVPVTFSASFTR